MPISRMRGREENYAEIVTLVGKHGQKNNLAMRSLGCRVIYVGIRNHVIGPLLDLKGLKEKLAIWSAGCGTGLELNDVREMIKQMAGGKIGCLKGVSLIGTDIDGDIIGNARKRFASDRLLPITFETGDIFDPNYIRRFTPASLDVILFLGFSGGVTKGHRSQRSLTDTFSTLLKKHGCLITDQPFFKDTHFRQIGTAKEPIVDHNFEMMIRMNVAEEKIPQVTYRIFLRPENA